MQAASIAQRDETDGVERRDVEDFMDACAMGMTGLRRERKRSDRIMTERFRKTIPRTDDARRPCADRSMTRDDLEERLADPHRPS